MDGQKDGQSDSGTDIWTHPQEQFHRTLSTIVKCQKKTKKKPASTLQCVSKL